LYVLAAAADRDAAASLAGDARERATHGARSFAVSFATDDAHKLARACSPDRDHLPHAAELASASM
jgi:hypothetical protein